MDTGEDFTPCAGDNGELEVAGDFVTGEATGGVCAAADPGSFTCAVAIADLESMAAAVLIGGVASAALAGWLAVLFFCTGCDDMVERLVTVAPVFPFVVKGADPCRAVVTDAGFFVDDNGAKASVVVGSVVVDAGNFPGDSGQYFYAVRLE